jgi:hypothetical protein
MLPVTEISCDPVGRWLEVRPRCAQLANWHSMRFAFAGTTVEVRSNSAEIVTVLRRQIGEFHPDCASASDSLQLCRIEINALQGEPDLKIELAVENDESIEQALRLPPPSATILSAEFVHLRWEDLECFWRPFDLLASIRFSSPTDVRLLVSLPPPRPAAPGEQPLRFRAKKNEIDPAASGVMAKMKMGGRRSVQMDEIVDLVRVMTVRAQGHYCLHAATLALDDRGIILMGPSGCGKTTTALSLLRGGFILLSDEHSALNATENEILLTGFRSAPRVRGMTPAGLDDLEKTLQFFGEDKRPVSVPEMKAVSGTPWLRRALMLFLRIGPGASEHRIERLSQKDAFVRVMEQVLDPTNVFRKAEQSQAIIRLIEQSPAYELVLGSNLASIPELVRGLVESSL